MKEDDVTFDLNVEEQRWFEQHFTQRMALEAAIQGAMSLIVVQNGLPGRWEMDWPRKRLVRADSLVPAEVPNGGA